MEVEWLCRPTSPQCLTAGCFLSSEKSPLDVVVAVSLSNELTLWKSGVYSEVLCRCELPAPIVLMTTLRLRTQQPETQSTPSPDLLFMVDTKNQWRVLDFVEAASLTGVRPATTTVKKPSSKRADSSSVMKAAFVVLKNAPDLRFHARVLTEGQLEPPAGFDTISLHPTIDCICVSGAVENSERADGKSEVKSALAAPPEPPFTHLVCLTVFGSVVHFLWVHVSSSRSNTDDLVKVSVISQKMCSPNPAVQGFHRNEVRDLSILSTRCPIHHTPLVAVLYEAYWVPYDPPIVTMTLLSIPWPTSETAEPPTISKSGIVEGPWSIQNLHPSAFRVFGLQTTSLLSSAAPTPGVTPPTPHSRRPSGSPLPPTGVTSVFDGPTSTSVPRTTSSAGSSSASSSRGGTPPPSSSSGREEVSDIAAMVMVLTATHAMVFTDRGLVAQAELPNAVKAICGLSPVDARDFLLIDSTGMVHCLSVSLSSTSVIATSKKPSPFFAIELTPLMPASVSNSSIPVTNVGSSQDNPFAPPSLPLAIAPCESSGTSSATTPIVLLMDTGLLVILQPASVANTYSVTPLCTFSLAADVSDFVLCPIEHRTSIETAKVLLQSLHQEKPISDEASAPSVSNERIAYGVDARRNQLIRYVYETELKTVTEKRILERVCTAVFCTCQTPVTPLYRFQADYLFLSSLDRTDAFSQKDFQPVVVNGFLNNEQSLAAISVDADHLVQVTPSSIRAIHRNTGLLGSFAYPETASTPIDSSSPTAPAALSHGWALANIVVWPSPPTNPSSRTAMRTATASHCVVAVAFGSEIELISVNIALAENSGKKTKKEDDAVHFEVLGRFQAEKPISCFHLISDAEDLDSMTLLVGTLNPVLTLVHLSGVRLNINTGPSKPHRSTAASVATFQVKATLRIPSVPISCLACMAPPNQRSEGLRCTVFAGLADGLAISALVNMGDAKSKNGGEMRFGNVQTVRCGVSPVHLSLLEFPRKVSKKSEKGTSRLSNFAVFCNCPDSSDNVIASWSWEDRNSSVFWSRVVHTDTLSEKGGSRSVSSLARLAAPVQVKTDDHAAVLVYVLVSQSNESGMKPNHRISLVFGQLLIGSNHGGPVNTIKVAPVPSRDSSLCPIHPAPAASTKGLSHNAVTKESLEGATPLFLAYSTSTQSVVVLLLIDSQLTRRQDSPNGGVAGNGQSHNNSSKPVAKKKTPTTSGKGGESGDQIGNDGSAGTPEGDLPSMVARICLFPVEGYAHQQQRPSAFVESEPFPNTIFTCLAITDHLECMDGFGRHESLACIGQCPADKPDGVVTLWRIHVLPVLGLVPLCACAMGALTPGCALFVDEYSLLLAGCGGTLHCWEVSPLKARATTKENQGPKVPVDESRFSTIFTDPEATFTLTPIKGSPSPSSSSSVSAVFTLGHGNYHQLCLLDTVLVSEDENQGTARHSLDLLCCLLFQSIHVLRLELTLRKPPRSDSTQPSLAAILAKSFPTSVSSLTSPPTILSLTAHIVAHEPPGLTAVDLVKAISPCKCQPLAHGARKSSTDQPRRFYVIVADGCGVLHPIVISEIKSSPASGCRLLQHQPHAFGPVSVAAGDAAAIGDSTGAAVAPITPSAASASPNAPGTHLFSGCTYAISVGENVISLASPVTSLWVEELGFDNHGERAENEIPHLVYGTTATGGVFQVNMMNHSWPP